MTIKQITTSALVALATICATSLQAEYPTAPQKDVEPPKTVKTSDGRELTLVWNDEFDGEGLPDPEKWNYEVGYERNNEAQYYTDKRVENVFQKDGALTIRTLKEKYPIKGLPKSQGREFADYTSGAIETLGKASWQYGRVEVRAKLPKGKGIWPAIWMMGDNIRQVGWPGCGEIDIMEYVGHTPYTAHGTIHMRRKGGRRWDVVSKGKTFVSRKTGNARKSASTFTRLNGRKTDCKSSSTTRSFWISNVRRKSPKQRNGPSIRNAISF